MKKNRTIKVDNTIVSICSMENDDYISITDMLKAKDGEFFISDWLRNRNTIEFLGVWEAMNNPNFNYGEFAIIKSQSGLNSYKISVKEWVEKTNGIGLCAKTGRYGGTYAHKDIAFEFGTWISPQFKLYLIKEFQRLKEIETKDLEWDYRRSLAATNYRIHTDAVKEHLIPFSHLNKKPDGLIYADEAELINFALFGLTSKQWRDEYPEETFNCKTLRDCADSNTLIVLSNLESLNAVLIKDGMSKDDRLSKLQSTAISQLESLQKLNKDYSNIESPNKRKLLEDKPDLTMDFGEAIRKISKAGKPK
ncbi:MAG: KilA-N domain-containing protein [Chitinophagaceae bacterium]|nr:KilA-N domain-containing protein [Chitinophagaceae bacterium]